MAQTIALYRGQVTMSQNTNTTLFTNTALGTATRLKVGYLGWQSNFANIYGVLSLGILRSGSANYVAIGASYGTIPNRNESFLPHNSSIAAGTGTGTTLPWLHGDQVSTLANYISISQNSNPTTAYYISDVLIGPSDAVALGWFDNGGGNRAAVVDYCIVGITE